MQQTHRRNLIVMTALACILVMGERTEAQRILRGARSTKQKQPTNRKQTQTKPKSGGQAKSSSPAPRENPATSTGLRIQVALDRSGFSPGIIDGIVGRKTRMAISAFQARAGLPATGDTDPATLKALGANSFEPTTRYTLSADDMATIAPPPKKWQDKAKAKLLGYESVEALAAERGHCTIALLRKLNPGVRFNSLRAGDTFTIPNATAVVKAEPAIARLEVDLGQKAIRAYDETNEQKALFHCSIAADRANLPRGECSIRSVSINPEYTFDPAKWPEVKGVNQRLTIPPGPRNPVGLCWIDLSLNGYGIHGTPAPELIGKTGSHGCIRLTNWDALRLSKMVRVGIPVRFIDIEPTDQRSAQR